MSLEVYLQELASLREAWSCPRFVEFLDDSHPFLGLQIQVVKLTNDVKQLRHHNSMLHSQLQEATAALSLSSHTIASLDGRLRALEQASGGTVRQASTIGHHEHRAPPSHALSVGADRLTNLMASDYSSPPKGSIGDAVSVRHISRDASLSRAGGPRELSSPPPLQQKQDDVGTRYPSWASSGMAMPQLDPPGATLRSSVVSPPPGLLSAPEPAASPVIVDSTTDMVSSSSSSTLADIPRNEVPSLLDHFVDTVLSYVMPTIDQLQFRYSVEKYIAKLVRKSLGAQLYQMGIQSLRCFLPDDPISLSIYLCRGLENSWYFRLNEKLCRMSAGGNMSSPTTATSPFPAGSGTTDGTTTDGERDRESSVSLDNIAATTDMDQEGRDVSETPTSSHHNHVISHVSFMNEQGEYRLQCLAGNTVVDIRANMKIDICFVAYLEEIDRIVGRDHLFKMSISLIRTWWTLEAPALSSSAITSEYLPDVSLLTMICAIFSRFHHRIFTPMQALCIFLWEYAAFDWSSFAVTAYGPVPVSMPPGNAAAMYPSAGIISQKVALKYRDMLAETDRCGPDDDSAEKASPAPSATDATPRRGSLKMLFGGVPEDEEIDTALNSIPHVASPYMKVYNPLEPTTNTVPETMTRHYVGTMTEVLNIGKETARQVLALAETVFRDASNGSECERLEAAVRRMFQKTVARFGRGWRPDVVFTGNGAMHSDDDISPRNSSSDVQSPFGAASNPQFLQDMKASEEEFT